jgi:hypothetical protein
VSTRLGDVQRDAAGGTHELIRQGTVMPLDTSNQWPDRRYHFNAE